MSKKKRLRACVDIGGTKILAAILDEDGKIIARHKAPTETGSTTALIAQVQDSIELALKIASAKKSSLAGVALGVPGVVREGVILLTPNVPLGGLNLGDMLGRKLGVPVVVANDGSMGTLGEVALGAARNSRSCYGFFVGTGIGGGLVLDGQLVEGARGLSGEVGHLLAPMWNGADAHDIGDLILNRHLGLSALCSREAIEKYLRRAIIQEGRASALSQIVRDPTLERIRAGALKKAMRQGDELVADVLRRCSYLLGLAAASVSNIVDPDVIVFGGGVIQACGEWMLPDIRAVAHRTALSGNWPNVEIAQSTLGDDAILIGGWKMLSGRLKSG